MKVVIPVSKLYESEQRKSADIIIDGNKSKEEILEDIKSELLKEFS